jgi:hypothetical protein
MKLEQKRHRIAEHQNAPALSQRSRDKTGAFLQVSA